MGRRARNKQPPPEAPEPRDFPTSKNLGKRKADSDYGKGNSRPTKKIKESNGKTKQKSPSKGKKKTVKILSDGDDEVEGWEDVEDEVGFTTLTKLGICFFFFPVLIIDFFLPGLYLTAVTMMMFSRVASMISK